MIYLDQFAMVAAPTVRSRAYTQAMKRANLLPRRILVLPGDEPIFSLPDTIKIKLRIDGPIVEFRPNETLAETLAGCDVPVQVLASRDVNAKLCVAAIGSGPEPFLIYSGFGGVLLRSDILATGKKFLHIHGGYVPRYRGSTAFYFSLLEEFTLGATALLLDEGIDTGPVLLRRKYQAIRGVSIDYGLDPMMRADVLVDVLWQWTKAQKFVHEKVKDEASATYYVIHPVLKHIALVRSGLVNAAVHDGNGA